MSFIPSLLGIGWPGGSTPIGHLQYDQMSGPTVGKGGVLGTDCQLNGADVYTLLLQIDRLRQRVCEQDIPDAGRAAGVDGMGL